MGMFVGRRKRLWNCASIRMRFAGLSVLVALTLCAAPCSFTQTVSGPAQPSIDEVDSSSLPDAPSATAPPSENFAGSLGTAAKTIGEDEWHFIKAPFHKKALIWDGLFLASTAC